MKEIFEKIVVDSAGKIANKITDELTGKSVEHNAKNIAVQETKESSFSQQVTIDPQQQLASHNIGVINAYSKNRRLNLMVTGAALGLVFCLLVLTTYKGDLPGEVVGIISTVSGIFGACLKDAYSFEFGSSRGSKEKDDRISNAILERLKK
ncbi:MAG: hypothetical protein IJT36_07000 [Alphaproteobacteria bacterium]|nr:hypothetical protein [Alphaproteobacteria bacterium]